MRQWRVGAGAVTLAVTEWAGAGPPLVLLHGLGSRGASWLPVADVLAARFHLYAPDLRGHGDSDKPARGYLVPDYAADLARLLDALGLERPLMVGHSLGALVALAWAAAHPERVAALALEDPPLRTEPGVLAAFDGWQALNALSPEAAAAWFAREHPEWSAEECRRRAESITATDPAVFAELRADAAANLASGRVERLAEWGLEAIAAPTLLLAGEPHLGSMTRAEDAARFAAIVPGTRLAAIGGAGHRLHAEQPERFVAAVLPFLETGEGCPQDPV